MNDDTTGIQDPEDGQSSEENQTPYSMGDVSDAEAAPLAVEAQTEPEVEPLPASDKMIGIYTEPEPVFDNLKKAGPRASDWLIPLGLMLIVLALATYVKFSDPEVRHQVANQQEERFEKLVAEGDMTQEQADQAINQMENMGGMMMGISIAGIVVGTPIMFLLIALFYWLVLRFAFKGTATYFLTFSALTLTMYISVLDPIFSLILGYATGNPFATLSPGLFFEHDPHNKLYLSMMALKPITLWSVAVLSIGFSRIAEISKAKAYALGFGTWLLMTILGIVFGGGQAFM